MKKSLSLFAILVFSLQLFAWAPPSYVVTPQLPGATLRVVGANTRNYLYDFTADNADCKDMECFNRKTENMAKVFVSKNRVAANQVPVDTQFGYYHSLRLHKYCQSKRSIFTISEFRNISQVEPCQQVAFHNIEPGCHHQWEQISFVDFTSRDW